MLASVQSVAAQRLCARLESRAPLVIDGSVAGALTRAGVDMTTPLGSAGVLQAQSYVMSAVHQRYCAAGVHLLRTNTIHTTPQALSRTGYGYRAAKLSSLAVDLAVEAAQQSGRLLAVAGVLPPMDGSDERLRGEQVAQAQRLAASGVDLIFIEAASTLREAVAATFAAMHTNLPVLVALHVGEDGHLVDGEHLEVVCSALAGAGARGFIAVPSDPTGEVRATAELASIGRPWGVFYAGARNLSPYEYAERGRELAQEGALLLGGESGATPEHIRELVSCVPEASREFRRPSLLPPASSLERGFSNLPRRS